LHLSFKHCTFDYLNLTAQEGTDMQSLIKLFANFGLFRADLDYKILRAAMVLIFYMFGYAKWWAYDVPNLVPIISHGPLISWLIPVFGPQGADYFLGTSEWTIGTLLLIGFWNKKVGILGAIGSTGTFFCTVTILPFLPGAWEASAGGFPALNMASGFLIKDVVLLAVSLHLLKQDALRVSAGDPVTAHVSAHPVSAMK
jgi:uncharacterized membrane protein YkgB